jgi:hypothetical protein
MHRFSVLLAIGVLCTMTGYGVSQSPPSKETFKNAISNKLKRNYIDNQVDWYKSKSVEVTNLRVGKEQPFNESIHPFLPGIDWGSPVYPIQYWFTLVSKDGKVERLMNESYCYLDSFRDWRCGGGGSPLPRSVE